MKRQSVSYYVNGILQGDRVILSQAITLIESNNPSDQLLAQQIIKENLNQSSSSIRVGITGVPGVGKSTFIEAFGTYLAEIGKKVAVLAVDPTSQTSKGSILGDKTRMQHLSQNNNAYIRPSASGDTLGGLAQKTNETILLCEAAGYDIILIETVGVGQSEIEVYHLTDFFLLLMLPGAGDELQGIKRGIMEMADMILINKAEQENLVNAKTAQREYKNAIHLFPAKSSGWIPEVILCSAIENKGIEDTWKSIESYYNTMLLNGYFTQKRTQQNTYWFTKRLKENIVSQFFKENQAQINQLTKEIEQGRTSPFEAANTLFKPK